MPILNPTDTTNTPTSSIQPPSGKTSGSSALLGHSVTLNNGSDKFIQNIRKQDVASSSSIQGHAVVPIGNSTLLSTITKIALNILFFIFGKPNEEVVENPVNKYDAALEKLSQIEIFDIGMMGRASFDSEVTEFFRELGLNDKRACIGAKNKFLLQLGREAVENESTWESLNPQEQGEKALKIVKDVLISERNRIQKEYKGKPAEKSVNQYDIALKNLTEIKTFDLSMTVNQYDIALKNLKKIKTFDLSMMGETSADKDVEEFFRALGLSEIACGDAKDEFLAQFSEEVEDAGLNPQEKDEKALEIVKDILRTGRAKKDNLVDSKLEQFFSGLGLSDQKAVMDAKDRFLSLLSHETVAGESTWEGLTREAKEKKALEIVRSVLLSENQRTQV